MYRAIREMGAMALVLDLCRVTCFVFAPGVASRYLASESIQFPDRAGYWRLSIAQRVGVMRRQIAALFRSDINRDPNNNRRRSALRPFRSPNFRRKPSPFWPHVASSYIHTIHDAIQESRGPLQIGPAPNTPLRF